MTRHIRPNVLLLGFSLAVPALAQECPELVFTDSTFEVGSDAIVLFEDVSGDDRADLISIASGGQMTVRLANEGGLYPDAAIYDVGSSFGDAVLADVSGVGRTDLVVTNPVTDEFGVLLNNGDGTFSSRVGFATANSPTDVSAADLNGDGALDLIILSRADQTITVHINNGSGTFGAGTAYSAPSPQLFSFALSDLDGDSFIDIVSSRGDTFDQPSNVGVFLNDGDGTFASPVVYPNGNWAQELKLADLNGDNRAEILTVNTSAFGVTELSVLVNDGSGSFAPRQTYDAGSFAVTLEVGDVNTDGTVDVVVADRSLGFNNGDFLIYIGDGDASFQPSYPASGGAGGYFNFSPSSSELTDVDNDGDLDIVTFSAPIQQAGFSGTDTWAVLFNDGVGNFVQRTIYPVPQPNSDSLDGEILVGDSQGDGDIDAVSVTGEGIATAYLNNGAGTFSGPERNISVAIGDPGEIAKYLLADLNGDGTDDIVATLLQVQGLPASELAVILSDGIGGFFPYTRYTIEPSVGLDLADLDGNGSIDIALSTGVLLNSGDGSFAPFADGGDPSSIGVIGVEDFDGNGTADIVGNLGVRPGLGNGSFPVRVNYTTIDEDPIDIAVGDLDSDGNADIAIAHSFNDLEIFFGDGAYGFSGSDVYSLGGKFPMSIVLEDLDQNGSLDVLVGSMGEFIDFGVVFDPGISVLLNQGTGTLGAETFYESDGTGFFQGFSTGDFDSDGQADIAYTTSSDGLLYVRYGMAGGEFDAPITFNLRGQTPRASDLNSDGKLDFIAADGEKFNYIVNKCTATPSCPADVTGDDQIDLADLNLVLANFGQTTTDGDANGDGEVDLADLNAVLAAFGTGCN